MTRITTLFHIPWNYNETGFELEKNEVILFDFILRSKLPSGVRMNSESCWCYSDNKKACSFTIELFRKLCSETANELAALCCCPDDERSENVKAKLREYGYTGRFAKDDCYTRTISQRIKYGPKPQRKQEKHTDFSVFFGY